MWSYFRKSGSKKKNDQLMYSVGICISLRVLVLVLVSYFVYQALPNVFDFSFCTLFVVQNMLNISRLLHNQI